MPPRRAGIVPVGRLEAPLWVITLPCPSLPAAVGKKSHSSVTSVLAQVAANAFLDAFAHDRTARGEGFTTTINWDAWREVGMAVTTVVPAELRAWREESLREGITPDQGVKAFDLVVASAYPQVIVSRNDFQERVTRHFTTRLPAELQEITEPQAAHARPNLANAYVAPETDLEKRLASIWEELLGIDQVGVHDNFFELGGNSLVGLKVTARIKSELQAEFTPVSLFEGPTVRSLAKLMGVCASPPTSTGSSSTSITSSSTAGRWGF
jgi:hypothetical protein